MFYLSHLPDTLSTMFTHEPLISIVSDNPQARAVIIALHGFGANARDLSSFSRFGTYPFSWRFVQAPIHLGGQGFAWFPQNISKIPLEDPLSYFHHLPETEEPDIHTASERVVSTIKQLKIPENLPIILAGFSQGAIVTLDILLRKQIPLHSAILFSGMPFHIPTLTKLLEQSVESGSPTPLPPIFQSHGVADPILPISYGTQLSNHLKSYCLDYDYQTFQGYHEIPDYILNRALEFVWERL